MYPYVNTEVLPGTNRSSWNDGISARRHVVRLLHRGLHRLIQDQGYIINATVVGDWKEK